MEPGERVLLVGPSGSGKSTLLLALAGLLEASGGESAGRLTVDGLDPPAARDRSALLLQDPEAQVVMGRVGDDVAFGLENRCVPPDAIWPRVDAALDAVGFPYGRERSTDALSGGEKQRLALAGTLAMRPALLLLDEPTASLDPESAGAFMAQLRRVVDGLGATLVMVEHRLDDALAVAGRIVALDAGGRVTADGPAHRVLSEWGTALEAAGVWVPGRPAPTALRASGSARPRDPMLHATDLSFTYPGDLEPALRPTDIRVHAGEALAVVGPNGSGKSTLALLLGGLLRPTCGSLVAAAALAGVQGDDPVWRWPARVLAGRIGSVFQDPEHQFLTGSVRDELRIGPRRLRMADADERADRLLERLGLAHLAAANPFTLSGGEQRRLSVATALAPAPALLVLDEPTYGQDRRTWTALLELLAELRDAGRALVVASHDRDFVDAIADRTLALPA